MASRLISTLIPTIAIFSLDFPSIPHAVDLLQSMQRNASFQSGAPSDDLVTFLNRIEHADPASADISQDDTNESWGHYQFTAASLTCRTAILSWNSVGSTGIACRLIAAAIKTCKVARHLCFTHNITSTSYLSDAYLSQIIELLWRFWGEAVGKDIVGCTHFATNIY